MNPADLTLYLVTDSDLCPPEKVPGVVEKAIRGGVTLVQLREKTASSREFYQRALAVKAVTQAYHVPLIINDRLDIALAVDADGLHIGQEDLPASVARRILGPDKLLGVSVSTVEEAMAAAQDGADHLGVGALFPTDTKEVDHLVDALAIRQIRQQSGLPLVGIGGIKASNMGVLRGSLADGVAVVSAIMCSHDPEAAARELGEAYRKAGVTDEI